MLITTNQMSTRYKPKDEKFINMLQWHQTGKFKQMKTSEPICSQCTLS